MIIIIQRVKENVSCQDVVSHFYQEPNRGGKVPCPFHEDSNPSMHIYDDGFNCFGCGVSGDQIAFVAKLEGVRPIEAARLIGHKFDLPIDRPPTFAEVAKSKEKLQGRNINNCYREIEERAFRNLADFKTLVIDLMSFHGPDVPDDILPAAHMLPKIEENMRILAEGTPEERLQLLREGEITRWASLTLINMPQRQIRKL
jgi:hypothetical protein